MKYLMITVFLLVGLSVATVQAVLAAANPRLNVAIVINPYMGDRAGPEKDIDAKAMAGGGLQDKLESAGADLHRISEVALSADEEKQYGRWNRFGFANKHLGDLAGDNQRRGLFNIGLFNNCSSAYGMLGGLQRAGSSGKSLRVAMVFVDAHGDFNTPETTLSGMLGGMPVAIAAGHALHNLRIQSGLLEPLPEELIVMAAVRDTDPLERERIDTSAIAQISVADIKGLTASLTQQMDRLSALADVIYVHIDLDVLEPWEVRGHPLTVPDGPTSEELAAALKVMFAYEKASALGIASYPAHDDPDLTSLRAVHNLIFGAIEGRRSRQLN